MIKTPEFLCIGHACHDKVPGGHTLGGAVSYAGVFAARLGKRSAALSSMGDDFMFHADFQGIALENVPTAQTTIFENIYQAGGSRIQYLHGRAADLRPEHLPDIWRQAPVVMLCPIADEVNFEFLAAFAPNSLVCACPQGWMRQWDTDGKVSAKHLDNWEALSAADVVSMSEADVNKDWALIEKIGDMANLLLVTQGAEGATVFQKGKRRHFPAFPVRELNPTGAGDIFAAAFCLRYAEARDLGEAMVFAHAAASLCVERAGGSAFHGMAEVRQRARQYENPLITSLR